MPQLLNIFSLLQTKMSLLIPDFEFVCPTNRIFHPQESTEGIKDPVMTATCDAPLFEENVLFLKNPERETKVSLH